MASSDSLIIAAALVIILKRSVTITRKRKLLLALISYLTRQQLLELEEQKEEARRAKKNAKIEQCLKLVDAKGQLNKKLWIEQWLLNVEAERVRMVTQQTQTSPTNTKCHTNQNKVVKPSKPAVRRSARLSAKKNQ